MISISDLEKMRDSKDVDGLIKALDFSEDVLDDAVLFLIPSEPRP